MKWTYLNVKGDAGIEEGLPCTVCGNLETDILYSPKDFNSDQEEWFERIWNCDPYSDFSVCEGCMSGHCGAVPGLDADNWLTRQIINYYKKELIKAITSQVNIAFKDESTLGIKQRIEQLDFDIDSVVNEIYKVSI